MSLHGRTGHKNVVVIKFVFGPKQKEAKVESIELEKKMLIKVKRISAGGERNTMESKCM